ncbi:uncharacterized protein LOC130715391 isoform X2 [Lotus japonicus]|uniref:uncharacterized protein LOC130715391 isoform X2 n=1 Tax=Lotus japonicus TaxID=34305 RepID=UPI00258DA6FE|nr:uncharacterized protein LOC130715391 isoform X2 [Lotus japonicus]
MSNSFRSDSDAPSSVEELVHLGTGFRQHRKEKDVLRSSQSQSFQPIRILERYEKSSPGALTDDKKHIQRLEKELLNCFQEIDFLQDRLNARNTDVNYLEERVRNLELKLEEMGDLQEEVFSLREELRRSNSKQFSLTQELETKEIELEQSAFSIEKLEDSFSSIALESQFEVESMKLDMMALEQSLFEAKKTQDEALEESNRLSRLIDELQYALQDTQQTITSLNEENRELREKLDAANMNTRLFSRKVGDWLENKNRSHLKRKPSLSEQESKPEDIRTCGEVLGPLLGRLAMILGPAADLKGKMEMPHQIQEYELLLKNLKN